MARFILVYTHPQKGERRFELAPDRSYRVGAMTDNDIVIDQKDVSRHHAILRVRDGDFHITDLNSKNGTYVNGQRSNSTTLHCGDMINISSALLVVVEVSSGAYAVVPQLQPIRVQHDEDDEDTVGFGGEASVEDMVALLATTSSAVRRGAVAEPLNWAVERFGFEGALVLYRDPHDNVALVTSAGDLGPLVRNSDTLARLAREQKGRDAGTNLQQLSEHGDNLLVAPMQRDHVLVVRFEGAPPAIADTRAVIAAVEAVLCSGNPPRPAGMLALDRRDPERRIAGNALQRIGGLSDIIGECKRRAVEFARRDDPVLIAGEPGTGKSLFARVIHDLSRRRSWPFVTVDCDALDPDLVARRLFGGDGGDSPPSAIRQAHEGTVFIKGLTRLTASAQTRLLDLILEMDGPRYNGDDQPLDVRIIASSSRDPDDSAAEGRLQPELVSAFRSARIELPPLCRRGEDIPLLVTSVLRAGGGDAGRSGRITVAALEALASYHWPDNVRELRNEVLRVMAAAIDDTPIEVAHLSSRITEGIAAKAAPPPDLGALARKPLADARADFERWMILRALYDSDGNQTRAARRLGLSRAGLFKKMRRLGVTWRSTEPAEVEAG